MHSILCFLWISKSGCRIVGLRELHSAVYAYRAMRKGKENMLTTAEVMRQLNAPYQTVVSWIKKGLFPGARLEESPRGPVWYIPSSDVDKFERPPMGRPRKPKAKKKK